MKPTRWPLLAAIVVLAAAVGWGLSRLFDSVFGAYVPVTWTAAGAVWLIAVSLLAWTVIVRPRLQRRLGVAPMDPLVAARTAALALACSRTGAAVLGVYAGFLLTFLGELATIAGQELAWASAVTALGGLAMIFVALWLESLCRIDDDDDDEGSAEEIGDVRGGISPADRASLH